MIMKKNNPTAKSSFGNLTPHAIEAEKAVIGAVINFREAFDSVSFLTPEMFYLPQHQALFEAVISINKRNAPIDIITVSQEIANIGKADEVPLWFITTLTQYVVSHSHVTEHALIVKQKHLQRQTMKLAMNLQSQAVDDTNDIGDVLFNAGKNMEALLEILVGQNDISSYEDISTLFYQEMQIRLNRYNINKQTGVTTGLVDLNRITSGWQGSELIILAARPAMGKTSMALHFAKSAALSGIPVLIFSLEMSKVSIYNRSVLAQCDKISAANLKSGNLLNDLTNIDKAVGQLAKLPIYVDDNANVNMAYIRSVSRLMHKKKKCGLIIIDYLQLITTEKAKYGNREQEISAMSREAKLIAKELDVPVILLSQLNRDVEKRQDKQPILSDLRESGAIEQDADMVLFIHRPAYYGKTVTDNQGNEVENAGELIIAKYRNGAIGKVKFKHNDTLTKVYDYTAIQLTIED